MTMRFSPSVFRTMFFLFATVLLFTQASFAEASDIRAVNALPTDGATFYTTDTITFLGTVENMVSENLPEVGYADIEIDWGSDGGPVNYNANPDNSENRLGSISSGGTLQLKEIISNPATGTHKYRFVADTADDLPGETDEDVNNFSPWVTFIVVPVPVAPTITFSGAPNPVTIGGSATLTWTVTDATSCTGSNGSGGWGGAKNASGGNQSVSPVVTTLYTLSCTGPGGSATKSFTVDVVSPAPTVSLSPSVNPISLGSSTVLTWSTTNADTCTASDGWSGAKVVSGNQTVSPITTTTYTLSCTGSGGTTVVSQTITVNLPLPTITISVSSTTIAAGGTTSVIWTVTNATFCRGSNGGGLPWDAPQNPIGSSVVVSTTAMRDYILSCSNPSAGTSTNRVTVFTTGLPNLRSATSPWANGNYINTSVGSTTTILKVGEANTIRAQVKNLGAAPTGAGSYTNKFAAVWGWIISDLIGYSTGNPSLDVGQINNGNYDESPSWTPTRAGHIELSFCADSSASVTEQNESDNCTYRSVNVATSSLTYPNLRFSFQGVNNNNSYISTTTKLGVTTTLAWNVSGATSCVGTSSPNVDPTWNGARSASGNNTFLVNPIIAAVNGYNNYGLICTGPGGEVIIKTIRINVVTVQPTVTITAASTSIARGTGTTISWTATDANTCTATSTPNDPNWSGSVSRNGGTRTTSNLSADTSYKVTCASPSGTTIKTVNVTVYDPPPVISLSAAPNPITPADATTLSWSASGASSCTGSSNPSDGTWNGARNIGESPIVIDPDVTTTYTLTCVGPTGSSANTEFTVSVSEQPPIIDFSLNDDIIIENKENATFLWDIRGATSCTGVSNPPDSDWDTFNFNADFSSSKTVSPTITTTYSIECSGPWGENSGQPRKINVVPEATITMFKVCVDAPGGECRTINETLEVNPGTPLTVEWDSDDATSCSAVSGGARNHTFSTSGNPSGSDSDVWATSFADSTDTYTIACGSAGFLTSDFVSITVHTNPVLPAIWITPKVVQPSGGSITVGWDTNNGDQSVCHIKGGGLTDSRLQNSGETGSASVPVLGRTSFVITCPSKDGLDTESATTTVELSPRIWGR